MFHIGVVLVGGKGTRLKNLTKNQAKPLLQINEKPFLDYLLYYICSYKFKKIYLICSYKHTNFFDRYHNKKILGVKVICINESTPKGTAGALYCLKTKIKNNFFLFNGDSFFPIDLDNFYNFSMKQDKIISIACSKNKNYKSNKKISNLEIIKNMIQISDKKSLVMNGGIYFIKKKFLSSIKPSYSSLENDHLIDLIANNKICGKIYNNYFIDIGLKKNLYLAKQTLKKNTYNKAFFLDRDGVINEDKGHVHKIKNFIFTKNFFKGLKILNENKYVVIIITNQAGIGRGYYTVNDLNKLHKYLKNTCIKKNSNIDDIYFCPHHPTMGKGIYKKNCSCRKPKPGMINRAINEWSINKKKSIMIGDKKTDRAASIKSGIKFYYKKNIPFNIQIKHILKKQIR
jgi:D-glycero-D-manno-heptose 1,7-bisphosphate phosphatase